MTTPERAVALLRTREYRRLLVIATLLGVPIAAIAYFFLALLNNLQKWVYTDLPDALGFDHAPRWWPLAPLLVSGLIVALIARYVPGRGGPTPVDGLHPGGTFGAVELAGIVVASIASVGLGPVIGPEGPLIAIGGGVALLAVRATRRAVAGQGAKLISITGSFAAISTLLGSPLVGALFLLEASGLGGTVAAVLLAPGLLASGVGALIFTGLGSLTGLHPLSLTVGNLPDPGTPTFGELGWALVVGIATPLLCWAIRRPARVLARPVNATPLLFTPLIGLAVAGLAIGYSLVSDQKATDVLFSGQTALPELLDHGAELSVGVVVALLVAKAAAYLGCLAAFRGGPIFPAVFIGAACGVLLSHAPGLPLVVGTALGITGLATAMLRLPISSVVLTTLLFGQAGIRLVPLTIITTVVAYVLVMLVDPPPPAHPAAAAAPKAAGTGAAGVGARGEAP